MLEKHGIQHLSAGLPTERQKTITSSGSTLIANLRLDMIGGLHIMGLRAYRRDKDGVQQVYLTVPKTEPNQNGKTMDYVVLPHEMQKAILAEVLKREAKGQLWDIANVSGEGDDAVDGNAIAFNKPFVPFQAFSVDEVREFLRQELAAAK